MQRRRWNGQRGTCDSLTRKEGGGMASMKLVTAQHAKKAVE